jgi:hypothetical protein
MRTNIYIGISLGILLLSGCWKEPENAVIEYYITANQSEEYDLLSFNLLWTSADTKGANRSVYLDPIHLAFNTLPSSTPDTIYLGRSDIEPGIINAYSFWITEGHSLWRGRYVKLQDKEYYESNEAPAGFSIKEGEIKRVLFVVQVDSSIIKLSDHPFKLLPKIKVVTE